MPGRGLAPALPNEYQRTRTNRGFIAMPRQSTTMFEQVRIGDLQLLQRVFPDRRYGRDAADLAFGRACVLYLDGKRLQARRLACVTFVQFIASRSLLSRFGEEWGRDGSAGRAQRRPAGKRG